MLLYRQHPPVDSISQLVEVIEKPAIPSLDTLVYAVISPTVVCERSAMRDFADIVMPRWICQDGVEIEAHPCQLVNVTMPNTQGWRFFYAMTDRQMAETARRQLKLSSAFVEAGMRDVEPPDEATAIRMAVNRLDAKKKRQDMFDAMQAAIGLLR